MLPLRVCLFRLAVLSIATFFLGAVVNDSEAFVTAALSRDERTADDRGLFCVPDGNGAKAVGSGDSETDPIEEQSFRCSTTRHDPATDSPMEQQQQQGDVAAANSLHGRLLCAARCAYGSATELRAGSPYFRGAGFLPGSSVQRIGPRSGLDACLVGKTVDGIVVAFRGTSGAPLEWLQNARINLQKVPRAFRPRPEDEAIMPPGTRIHAGFSDILAGRFGRGIKAAILDLLDDDDDDDAKIYVTGHSKGGSVAALFALMMHHDTDLDKPELVCTFGAARVGNSAFQRYYDNLVNQVTYENDGDIVPFLPPGQTTMDDIEHSTNDPEAMMEMLDDILDPPTIARNKGPRRNRESWKYHPIGRRTYIDPSGNLFHPVPNEVDTSRIKDLEGKNLRDFRRAHCSSCSIEDDEEDDESNGRRGSSLSACSGGYFAALAPEICERSSVASA